MMRVAPTVPKRRPRRRGARGAARQSVVARWSRRAAQRSPQTGLTGTTSTSCSTRTSCGESSTVVGAGGGAADEDAGLFGPVALFAGGEGEVRFRDVSYKDLGVKRFPNKQISSNFRMLRLTPFYYSFSAAAADMNRDGHLKVDVVAGPFIYYGPGLSGRARVLRCPDVESVDDVLAQLGGVRRRLYRRRLARRAARLDRQQPPLRQSEGRGAPLGHVSQHHPAGESVGAVGDEGSRRRWYAGAIYGSAGAVRFAKPIPRAQRPVDLGAGRGRRIVCRATASALATSTATGASTFSNPTGWWEQPADGVMKPRWAFHPSAFGRGGAEMCVYDVNGDGRNDVVTSLQAHGFGLAWFEQRRDGGEISFAQHDIAGNLASTNAGGVTFSEPHGSTCADVDRDGVPDFIVGKRFFSHIESFLDPDPYGAPVLYIYRTVRRKSAPGGAEFVPELVHNRSGAGSQVLAIDLNKDGAVDLGDVDDAGCVRVPGQSRRRETVECRWILGRCTGIRWRRIETRRESRAGTGAGRGIGRGIAEVFADEGADVAINDIDAGGGAEAWRLTSEQRRPRYHPGRRCRKRGDVEAMFDRRGARLDRSTSWSTTPGSRPSFPSSTSLTSSGRGSPT